VILVDTNVLLRYLTPPTDAAMQIQHDQARGLMESIERGEVLATTLEVVLHETCYLLNSPRVYGQPVGKVAPAIRAVLQFSGWRFPAGYLSLYERALDLWELHPKLEFSDAVIAARCERGDLELASFDRHFEKLPQLRRWQPAGQDVQSPPES
jgi:predicted nucleic acid-binding protein